MRREKGRPVDVKALRAAVHAIGAVVGERGEDERTGVVTSPLRNVDVQKRGVIMLEWADVARGMARDGQHLEAAVKMYNGAIVVLALAQPFITDLFEWIAATPARAVTPEAIARKALELAGLSHDDAKNMIRAGGGTRVRR